MHHHFRQSGTTPKQYWLDWIYSRLNVRIKSLPLQSLHSKYTVWVLSLQLLHHILQIRIELSKKKKKEAGKYIFFNSELMWDRALMWARTYRAQFFIEDAPQVWHGWEDWNVASNTTRNNENTSRQYVSAATELVCTSVNSPFKECWQLLFQFIINAFIDGLGSAHLLFRLQWRRDKVDGKVLTEWEDMIWHLCPPSLSWRRPSSSQSAAPPGGGGRSRSQPVFFPFWKLSPVHGVRPTVLMVCVPVFESLVVSLLVLSKCSPWFHCWLCFCLLAACRLTLASGNWHTYVSMVRTAWSNSFTS